MQSAEPLSDVHKADDLGSSYFHGRLIRPTSRQFQKFHVVPDVPHDLEHAAVPDLESDGRKSHDRAGSLTVSQDAQRPGTVGATAGATANGEFVEKAPLVGMYARHVTAALVHAVSLGICVYN